MPSTLVFRGTTRFHWTLGLPITALLAGLIAGSGVASAQAPTAIQDDPRPTMRQVFEEMKILIPLSLDEATWADPDAQPRIRAALDRLENAATALEVHGRSREAGFNELALNLERDLREVGENYRIGAFEEARFFLTGSLQSCVSCHVRLPSARTFPFADQLIDQVEVQSLDPRERAWLYVTVRKFDAALSAWEGLMADPKLSPAELDAGGALVDYLNVVLRVRTDVPRARKALATLAARKDMPVYLGERIASWRAALDKLDPASFQPGAPKALEKGSALAIEAGQVAQGPFGRDGLIQDLAAASLLVRWLEEDRARRETVTRNPTAKERSDTSQAYYWLGVVEARSLDGFWVNLSERHLESAIRADPKGSYAKKAYARLEETQFLGYGGASGNELPADVVTNLRELRELIQAK
ncbi:MAG: hypothetical protein IPK00_09390 [Deltaproteobacteria bacterium]|nr:hypothetical protein [Deltaproteobacteria bacterium]